MPGIPDRKAEFASPSCAANFDNLEQVTPASAYIRFLSIRRSFKPPNVSIIVPLTPPSLINKFEPSPIKVSGVVIFFDLINSDNFFAFEQIKKFSAFPPAFQLLNFFNETFW